MIPVVNEKYQYIFFYSAKAGCSSLRKLYLLVHDDEFTEAQKKACDEYHNLSQVHLYDDTKNYSDYYQFLITRNPYSRIVSGFLDQYVYFRNDSVCGMVKRFGEGVEPTTFREFLQLLVKIPDQQRDVHFQTQSCTFKPIIPNLKQRLKKRFFGIEPTFFDNLDYYGDISGFKSHMPAIYSDIFKNDKSKYDFAISKISEIKKTNATYYGKDDYDDAANLSAGELELLAFAPKPQDFLRSEDIVALIDEIYDIDFRLFSYKKGELPNVKTSPEVYEVPDDFDWKMYLRLNPDLELSGEVYNERKVVRHYLDFGRHEKIPRVYKIEAPEGFDWQRYLNLNVDLPAAGITTEMAAIEHYISYGVREKRSI